MSIGIRREYSVDNQSVNRPTIRNCYIQAVHDIMNKHRISAARSRPDYNIPIGATFTSVVQYMEWYIAGGEPRSNPQSKLHYRYDRYLGALNASGLSSRINHRGIVHFDIGCGPGLFSWAFLDWAREHKISHSDIALYGYDHSQQMVELAHQMRDKLKVAVGGYPAFFYSYSRNMFLEKLEVPYDEKVDCVVTLGHVLAGNHDDRDILEFGIIIQQVMQSQHSSTPLTVIECDAVSEKHRSDFEQGWGKLLQALRERGLVCNEVPTGIYSTSDRCVLLSRREV